MKSRLSRVYFDGQPVTLMGDEATPPLSRIIRAGGKSPQDVDVLYLTSPTDPLGHIVGAEEIIDRLAEPTRPIYLRSVPHGSTKPIHTALSDPDWPSPVVHSVPDPGRSALRDVDPVIAQLGRDHPRRHVPGVFKAPSDPRVPPDKAAPPDKANAKRKARKAGANAAAQADAEAQAEDRQESERNQEDTLSDEQEDADDADDDLKLQGQQGASGAKADDE